MMILGLETQIVIFLLNIGVAVSQITGIGNEAHGCSGRTFDFNWNYTSGVSILIVEWNVNVSTNIATEDIGGSQPFTQSPGYNTRLTKLSDVGIALSSLSESDYGDYGCSVTNMNGKTVLCPPVTLFVYDPWSEVLSISKTGGGDSVLLQSSINDDRTSYSWIYKDKEVGSGFKYKATENGNYTLTLGKRGLCLSGSSRESIVVTEVLAGCKYSVAELFLGGFSCFLIVFITFIIMLIILGCKMLLKIFGDLSTNKKTIKIIIIAVFILVALIIGLALGFGLKECNQRDLGLGLGLGLGFLLAIALVVTLYIYHRQCDSKKGNEDENRESPTEINSKKPEDNPKRVRSTASASHVKMESKVHSEN